MKTSAFEAINVHQVFDILDGRRFSFRNEADLQWEMSAVLTERGVDHEREVRLTDAERIDFLTLYGVGIEVKIAGSRHAVLAQLQRYARAPQVKELLLVTTKVDHVRMPSTVGGCNLRVLPLLGGF